MDVLDKFFIKYSYKFPKGYPDLKDKQDILLLESILEGLELNEVELERDDYVSTPEIEFIKEKITNNKNKLGFELSHIKGKKFYFKGIPSKGARNTRYELLDSIKNLFPENEVVTIKKDSPIIKIKINDKVVTFEVKGAGSEFSTNTNQKEGLVIFFYNSDVKDLFTSESLVKNWKDLYNGDYFKGLEDTNKKEVEEFLSRYNKNIEGASKNKVALDALNDPLSAAILIKGEYGNKNPLITGKGTFEDIRTVGKELAKIDDKDKWNPGDVYLRLPGKIITKEEAINSPESLQPIAIFNQNFTNEWGALDNIEDKPAAFVSISLKQEKAAAGKGKGYLKDFDPQQFNNKLKSITYNLTEEEKEWDDKKIKKEIQKLRDQIEGNIKGLDPNVKYNPGDIPTIRARLLSKYASLKLLYFINLEISQGGGLGMSKAIGSLASYAASLTGVNPTYFKVTGNSKGEASVKRFPAEANAQLKPGTKLEIIDKGSNGGIQIDLTLEVLDNAQNAIRDEKFTMNIRSNGTGQNTIELNPSK
jgi:hypothetical protein